MEINNSVLSAASKFDAFFQCFCDNLRKDFGYSKENQIIWYKFPSNGMEVVGSSWNPSETFSKFYGKDRAPFIPLPSATIENFEMIFKKLNIYYKFL